jgi:RNA polymerase sigma factor (sigma-70 family)
VVYIYGGAGVAPDLDLVRRYAATQDAEALAAIIHRHQSMVYGTCMRILGNNADAEDAAQECFLKLVRYADRVRYSLAGWLHRCATHICLNARKQAQARRRREQLYRQTRQAESYGGDAWNEIASHLDEALDELPPEHRYLLVECYLRQRSRTEVARELNVSRVTLYRRLDGAVRLLRAKLRQAGVLASVGVLVVLLEEHGAVAAPPSLSAQLAKVSSAFSRAPLRRPAAEAPQAIGAAKGRLPASGSIAGAVAGLALTAALIVGVYRHMTAGGELLARLLRQWTPAPTARVQPSRPLAADRNSLAAAVEAIVGKPGGAAPAEPNEPTAAEPAGEDESDEWDPIWITPEAPAARAARRAPAGKHRPNPQAQAGCPFAPPDVVAARIDAMRRRDQAEAMAQARPARRSTRRQDPCGISFTVYQGKVSNGQVISKSKTRVSAPRPLAIRGPRPSSIRLK